MVSRRVSLVLLASLCAACPSDDAGGETDGGTGGSETSMTGTTSTSSTTSSTSSASSSTSTSSPSTTGVDTEATATDSTDTGATATDTTGSTGGSAGSTSTGTAACEGMSFFATSVGSGESGGNLGGLDGADASCQALAEAAGQGDCTWRAYLSTSTVDARDRIGAGPWENFNGDVVAASVMALHDDGLPNGDPQLVFDETGAEIPGNEHDILTGSTEEGTYLDGTTCADWTSNSPDDDAGVGHSDIPANPQFSPSWVTAHVVSGCSQQNLQSTGGAGRLYCFAQ